MKRRTSDADDIGFFRTMFDILIKEGIADENRIYVTGGSNGGVMTQLLVCHLADRIAGAGVVVATLPRAAEKDWPKQRGREETGTGPKTRDISAPQEFWEFFKS